MLLPKYWLRRRRLQRALANYPVYTAPHRTEERILSKEKALENFQYFLDVRIDRVLFFNSWLSREFGVDASLEPNGIERILDWADQYIPIIMPSDDPSQMADVYQAYAKPWVGDYGGANAFFDFGAALGEAVLRLYPKLRWQMQWSLADYTIAEEAFEPETMALLRCREKDIRQSKREKWSGYHRPILGSDTDPVLYEPIYDTTMTYFIFVSQNISLSSAIDNAVKPPGLRSFNCSYLRDWFHTLQHSPPGPKVHIA